MARGQALAFDPLDRSSPCSLSLANPLRGSLEIDASQHFVESAESHFACRPWSLACLLVPRLCRADPCQNRLPAPEDGGWQDRAAWESSATCSAAARVRKRPRPATPRPRYPRHLSDTQQGPGRWPQSQSVPERCTSREAPVAVCKSEGPFPGTRAEPEAAGLPPPPPVMVSRVCRLLRALGCEGCPARAAAPRQYPSGRAP
mmetsp:Transcript_22525/g.65503  ORF Transcript_22525/g.65503 Transcript_22525/m.65503 type:complete len:202 (-) Transcript_22525:176-781(-)